MQLRGLSQQDCRMPAYAELQTTSNFGFLRGASHPEELVVQAQALGLAGLALTDRNSLAGVVRAHAQAEGQRPALPGRLPARSGGRHLAAVLADRPAGLRPAQLAAHPRQAAGGQGRMHADAGRRARPTARGSCSHCSPPETPDAAFAELARPPARALAGDLYLALAHRYAGDDAAAARRASAALARAPGSAPLSRPTTSTTTSRAAAAAGRADLHPRALHDRRTRPRSCSPTPSGI